MFSFIKLLLKLNKTFSRIASALEKLAGIEKKVSIPKKDFKIYSKSEEQIVEEEDSSLSFTIERRLQTLPSTNRSFYIEDDIRDIKEDINET